MTTTQAQTRTKQAATLAALLCLSLAAMTSPTRLIPGGLRESLELVADNKKERIR